MIRAAKRRKGSAGSSEALAWHGDAPNRDGNELIRLATAMNRFDKPRIGNAMMSEAQRRSYEAFGKDLKRNSKSLIR